MNINQLLKAGMLFFMLLISACQRADQSISYTESPVAAADESLGLDTARRVIQTGEINLVVTNIEKDVEFLRKAVNSLNGHTNHYEIENQVKESRHVQCHFDSMLTFNEIQPSAFMKIKIPVENIDSFIHTILAMNVQVAHFMLDEEDITENLEEQSALSTFYLGNHLNQSKKINLSDLKYSDEKIIKGIAINKTLSKLNYKTKYLWFDIHLNGLTYYTQQNEYLLPAYHTPFHISVGLAFQKGWLFLQQGIVALIHLWPFILLAILLYVLIKSKKGIYRIYKP